MNKESRRLRDFSLGRMNVWEGLGLLLLILYPLRHVNWGLDLWDTGYNYANFRYFGTEHMDPMWFFSTFLANGAGSLLMKLPGAGTLIGMNFYTGLSVSILAVTGYLFCTRGLGIQKTLAFAGELTAVSLCWCPTALLYNYLTYVLFLFSMILLYMGLVKEKEACLIGAGALLGTNLLVRFSNLPEAGMILAVWAYDFILWRREKKPERNLPARGNRKSKEHGAGAGQKGENVGAMSRWPRPLRHTFWCLTGYLAALGVLLGFLHVRYGIADYVSGIRRLFAMTDKAVDYKPTAMIMGIVGAYAENLYWVVRILIILAGGILLTAAADRLEGLCKGKRVRELFHRGSRVLCALMAAAMLGWLYYRKFCSLEFTSYDSMLRPGVLFLMLTLFIGAVRILSSGARAEEKLISGMLILIILLTSLGSNNGIYPSLNNLFLAAPYTFWQSWRFMRHRGDRRLFFELRQTGRSTASPSQSHAADGMHSAEQKAGRRRPSLRMEKEAQGREIGKRGLLLSCLPVKLLLASFLAMCVFQFAGFGAGFVFAEATGVRDASAYVENNAVLRNVRMNPQKARWMEELSGFVDEKGLQGRETILYGYIPALSYYLQMPSAFNPWSDLDSYSCEVMEGEMERLRKAVTEQGAERPVIIIENEYALYGEGGLSALEAAGVSEKTVRKIEEDQKWPMLRRFMEELGYGETFRNEKFAVYQ